MGEVWERLEIGDWEGWDPKTEQEGAGDWDDCVKRVGKGAKGGTGTPKLIGAGSGSWG